MLADLNIETGSRRSFAELNPATCKLDVHQVVRNLGPGATPADSVFNYGFTMTYVPTGTVVYEYAVDWGLGLDANQEFAFSRTGINWAMVGEYSIEFWANSPSSFAEINTANNRYTFNFDVYGMCLTH